MRIVAVTLLMLGCTPLPVPAPGEPPPVYTPRPVPPPIRPTPEPEPQPSPLVRYPRSVKVGERFVILFCGPNSEENILIRFDGKWDAGGLMGWQDGCKRQTIDGLNTSGERTFQFIIDGASEPVSYPISVR